MRQLPSDMRAEMTYPCTWSYRVIGADQDALRFAVKSVGADSVVSVELSNASRSGRYVSLKVVALVKSEEERLALYDALRSHESVVLVI